MRNVSTGVARCVRLAKLGAYRHGHVCNNDLFCCHRHLGDRPQHNHLFYVRNPQALAPRRCLLAVLCVDTLRNIIENSYFGIYFGSVYGTFPAKFATVVGVPILLVMPKLSSGGLNRKRHETDARTATAANARASHFAMGFLSQCGSSRLSHRPP